MAIKNQRPSLVIFIIIVSSLLLTMCAPAVTETPEARPLLRIAPEAGLSGLDPHSNKAIIDNIISGQLYNTLIGFDDDYQLAPALATSWTRIDDLTCELALREGVTFHDGTPFNAEAVKFNIERAINPDTASRSNLFSPFLASAEVIDEYSIRVKTVGPTPYLPYVLASSFLGIVSPKAATELGADYSRSPVGTGPYKFVKWVEGEYVEMAANDDYWEGAPNLSGITWRLIPSESARAVALQAGEVDVISNPPTELMPDFENDSQYTVIKSPANVFVGVWMNPEVEAIKDVRIRKAIYYAIDQQAILDNIIRGFAEPAYQVLGPSVFGMLSDDQIPEGGFYPFDPARSKQLLEEAGWTDTDGDGFVDKDGSKLTVVVQTPEGRYLKDRQIAEATTTYLQDVGIDANLKVVEFPTHSADVTQHNVEVFILSWSWPGGYPEPAFYPVFHTTEDGGQAAWAQWINPEADALMEEALIEPDEDARRELYQKIQLLVMDNAIMKPIYFKQNLWVASSSVTGLKFLPNEEPTKMINVNISNP